MLRSHSRDLVIRGAGRGRPVGDVGVLSGGEEVRALQEAGLRGLLSPEREPRWLRPAAHLSHWSWDSRTGVFTEAPVLRGHSSAESRPAKLPTASAKNTSDIIISLTSTT